jgi:transposase
MVQPIVRAADIQDRDGGALLLAPPFGLYPFPPKRYADAGGQGPAFKRAMKCLLCRREVETVKRSDRANGLVALPKRWVVGRTLAWLNRCGELDKDWENLDCRARAFRFFALIRRMVGRLCRAIRAFRIDSERR